MHRFYMKELDELRGHFLLMAETAMSQLAASVEALRQLDVDKARAVRAQDDALDELEVKIDAEASRYLTLRSPVAGDVRLLTMAMKASHDLERIGDEACSIAKRTLRLAGQATPPLDLHAIPRMAELALANTREAIDSLLAGSAERALAIPPRDREIDGLHRANEAHFIAGIEARPDRAPVCMELMFVSKSLERVGDHAANIAEEIVFLFTGTDVRHSDAVKHPG